MPDLWTDLLECLDIAPRPTAPQGQPSRIVRGAQPAARVPPGVRRPAARPVHPGRRLMCPERPSSHCTRVRPGGTRRRAGRLRGDPAPRGPLVRDADDHRAARAPACWPPARSPCTSSRTDPSTRPSTDVPPLLGPEHRARTRPHPVGDPRGRRPQRHRRPGPPQFEFWMRTPDVDPALAPALAAYATDLTLIGTALRPMDGLGQRGNGTQFTSAVTSHTLWFHRPFRTDEWLLLAPAQPAARARPLLRPRRCPDRERRAGRLLRPGGASEGRYLSRRQPEKAVLLSGEYKLQKVTVPLTPVRRW